MHLPPSICPPVRIRVSPVRMMAPVGFAGRARPAGRLLGAGLVAAGLLTGCGAPPQPLPTGPPPVSGGTGSTGAPGSAYPIGVPSGLPTPPLAGLPTTVPGLPAGGYTPPTVTTPTTSTPPVTRPTRPTSTVPPAPKCRTGPTAPQVLATLRAAPGVPTGVDLIVSAGPFCAGLWQFTTVDLKSGTNEKLDPLLVVTRGKPSALTLVEAGGDVCSDTVQNDAPPSIRVRACGT